MSLYVSNASPLILLSMMGELELLKKLFGEVWIAEEVRDEVVARGQGKPGSRDVAAAAYVKVDKVRDSSAVAVIRDTHKIGTGEAATIALARQLNADLAIVDDKEARTAARAEGIAIAGTMRVLEASFEKGHIKDLRAIYQRFMSVGARISPTLLNDSLRYHNLPPLA